MVMTVYMFIPINHLHNPEFNPRSPKQTVAVQATEVITGSCKLSKDPKTVVE